MRSKTNNPFTVKYRKRLRYYQISFKILPRNYSKIIVIVIGNNI